VTLDDLKKAAEERAGELQSRVLLSVLKGLQRRHISGGEPDCVCSYCEQLPSYIQQKILYQRAKRREDWDINDLRDYRPSYIEMKKNNFEDSKRHHRNLKMLDAS
jgi:hypothetical protein